MYSGGNRLGTILAYRLGYDFAIYANDDVEVKRPVYAPIANVFERYDDVGVIMPRVVQGGKVLDYRFFYREFSATVRNLRLWLGSKFADVFTCDAAGSDLIHPSGGFIVPWVLGAFMAIRLLPFVMVGSFSYRMFLGAEELEISDKLRSKGYLTVYFPDMGEVVHFESMTVGKEILYSKYYWGYVEYLSKVYGFSRRKNEILSTILSILA